MLDAVPPRRERAAPVRVFLAADQEIVRRGLVRLFRDSGDVVVGEAGGAAPALARVRATRPQVVVVAVPLRDGNGVDLCRELRRVAPGAGVVLLSAEDDDEARTAAAVAGASAFLLRSASGRELLETVRRAAAGERPPADGRPLTSRLALLTEQELRVLALLGLGLTNREIGGRLRLREKTVKNHVTHLLRKLGMARRTQAAVLAVRLRIPPPGQR